METLGRAGSLTGAQKTAILLIALGDQASAGLLKQLSEEQVQAVSGAIAGLSSITPTEAESVLQEFRDATTSVGRVGSGGITYAKRLLTSAFGPEGSKKHLDQLPGETGSTRQLQNVEPQLLARFVKSEHPQTVAIVLSQLNPSQSAGVLASMDPLARPDIALRIGKLDKVSPIVVEKISAVIGQKLKSLGEMKRQPSGGPRAVAEIFNQLDTELSGEILTKMSEENAELTDSIRQKMFVFDDLMALDANGVKELLARADRRQLTTALKGTNEELRQHLLKGMSQRGAAMLLEDMEALGPIKIREVEAAQQAMIAVIRQLETEGVLSLKGAAVMTNTSSRILRDAEEAVVTPITWRTTPAPAPKTRPDPIATRDVSAEQPVAQGDHLGQQERERIEQEAYHRGFSEGKNVGREHAKAELQPVLDQLGKSLATLSSLRSRIRTEAEGDLLKLAISIARRVLHRELTLDPESIEGLIRVALDKLQSRELCRVRVHPDQENAIRNSLERFTNSQKVEVVADSSMQCGDVLFETVNGNLDASIEAQLREIERGFADRLRRLPAHR